MSHASTARAAHTTSAAHRTPPPKASPAPGISATTDIGTDALFYLKELEDYAGNFMHEAESLMTFMEYSDENHSKQWTAALGIMLPIARRFHDYARLFADLGDDLRKSLVN